MGYETDRFNPAPKDELLCIICTEVLEDPLECSYCQTNFCSSCINMWQKKNNLCPNRCELKLQNSHKFLRSVLDNLIISCSNKALGCLVECKLEYIKKHESQECEYRKIKCKNDGCEEYISFCHQDLHNETCEMRRISCQDCKDEFPLFKLQEHRCLTFLASQLLALKIKVDKMDKTVSKISHRFPENSLHFGASCSDCKVYPIQGIRYICLECPDFSLCWRCKNNNKHNHQEFFQLNKEGSHNGVTCDGCRTFPIPNIRFKCQTCSDFGIFLYRFLHIL